MKKSVTILGLIVTLIIIAATGWYIYSAVNSEVYYTQIDNSNMTIIDTDGGVINFKGSHPYSYTLTCYKENGSSKTLTFGASKELREGAYLRLVYRPVRGVVGWWEVQSDELPTEVKNKY